MNRKLWMHPQEAAVSLGIAVKTLRRWAKAGKLHVARTAGHQRRIGMAKIQRLQRQGEQAGRWSLYGRVSTALRVAAAEREYRAGAPVAQNTWDPPAKRRGM